MIVGFVSLQGQNQKFVSFIGKIELHAEIKIKQAVNQLIAAGKKEMIHLELRTVSIQKNHLINRNLFVKTSVKKDAAVILIKSMNQVEFTKSIWPSKNNYWNMQT